MRDNIYKHFSISSIFHVLIFLSCVFTMKYVDFSSDNEKFNLQLVESSIRVDMVAMPELTIKEIEEYRKAESSAPKIVETKEDLGGDVNTVFEKKKEKVDIADLLKSLSKRKIKDNVKANPSFNKKKSRISNSNVKNLQNLILKGNKVNQGASASGSGRGIQEKFGAYISKIPDLVRPNWIIPSYLDGKDLRCRIRIYLDENGKLLRAELFESSGDEEYDRLAMVAVRQTNFSAVEEEFADRARLGEIVLGFPL